MKLRRTINIILATLAITLVILILSQIEQRWDTLSDIQRHFPLFIYPWIVIMSLSNFFNLDYMAKKTNLYQKNIRSLIIIASISSILIEFTMSSGVFMIVMHWIFAIIFGAISYILLLYFIHQNHQNHPFLKGVFWFLIIMGAINLLSIPYFGYMPGYMEAFSIIMCMGAYIIMSVIKIEEASPVEESRLVNVMDE